MQPDLHIHTLRYPLTLEAWESLQTQKEEELERKGREERRMAGYLFHLHSYLWRKGEYFSCVVVKHVCKKTWSIKARSNLVILRSIVRDLFCFTSQSDFHQIFFLWIQSNMDGMSSAEGGGSRGGGRGMRGSRGGGFQSRGRGGRGKPQHRPSLKQGSSLTSQFASR